MANEIRPALVPEYVIESAEERSIEIADENAIRVAITSIAGMAKTMVIESADDVAVAEGLLMRCREARQRVEAFLGPHIKRAYEQHRALTADKRKFTDAIDAAERELNPKLADWIHREKQRQLAADRERVRIDVAIEQKAGETADAAYSLAKSGDHERAAAVVESGYADVETLEKSKPDSTPIAEPEMFTSRTKWDFEITDPTLVPDKFKVMVIDEKLVRLIVNRLKDQFNEPGIRAFPVRTVVAKRQK